MVKVETAPDSERYDTIVTRLHDEFDVVTPVLRCNLILYGLSIAGIGQIADRLELATMFILFSKLRRNVEV